jgi:hypothetical protein
MFKYQMLQRRHGHGGEEESKARKVMLYLTSKSFELLIFSIALATYTKI